MARRAQCDWALLHSYSQRLLHKPSISKSLSGVKDRERYFAFDALYKPLYDTAVAQPQRPIYLENGQWGPAYMDAYWYATVEGRPISEFVRLAEGAKPPSVRLSLAQTQTARTATLSRKAERMSFTERSSREFETSFG
jgi:hypothetical protein